MSEKQAKALMALGTASHVGKSLTVAALCRIFRQDGHDVAPFKAQNMALNSFATREGDEIGRAQAMQAQAAGIEPHVDMNPLLLKPTSDTGTQIVLNGKVYGNATAASYQQIKPQIFRQVANAYGRLAARHDFIILEGAGSPVEMNLKDGDIVNLKMAEEAEASCLLVADIDRGGVFASLIGTFDLLTPDERKRFGGFIINKFRGDIGLLKPGVDFLEERLQQPCLGVIPYLHDLRIEEEDSVALDDPRHLAISSNDAGGLRIAVVRLPHMSNYTDFLSLQDRAGISLYYAQRPAEARGADVLILPGTKNTIGDLEWLRATGWADAVSAHFDSGRPVIGICGGFQMMGREVRDPFHVESDKLQVAGLGLIDAVTSLTREKVTRQAKGHLQHPEMLGGDRPAVFEGYEIHMGETELGPDVSSFLSLVRLGDESPVFDGAISHQGRTIGTYLHGLFDCADGAAVLLNHLRQICGRPEMSSQDGAFDREREFDRLAAHFRNHLDMPAIYRLVGIEP